jgi:ATP-dependent helicase YprA (DUF1998 family)
VPPILLHGVTGSGKTEIYLQAVQEVISQGKQAIILVPKLPLRLKRLSVLWDVLESGWACFIPVFPPESDTPPGVGHKPVIST